MRENPEWFSLIARAALPQALLPEDALQGIHLDLGG
jgi:hypothetical protein